MGFVNRTVEGLRNREGLEVEYLIPDGLSSLKACVDLKGKTLTNSMTIGAPEDRKNAKARVNRPLRQLAKAREDGIHIRATCGRSLGVGVGACARTHGAVRHSARRGRGIRATAAGVDVEYRDCEGMIHGFFTMASMIDGAVRAQAQVCRALRSAFAQVAGTWVVYGRIIVSMDTITMQSTCSLDDETVRQLEELAKRWNTSNSAALRRAVQSAAKQVRSDHDETLDALDALDRLQTMLALDRESTQAWADAVRQERQAVAQRNASWTSE